MLNDAQHDGAAAAAPDLCRCSLTNGVDNDACMSTPVCGHKGGCDIRVIAWAGGERVRTRRGVLKPTLSRRSQHFCRKPSKYPSTCCTCFMLPQSSEAAGHWKIQMRGTTMHTKPSCGSHSCSRRYGEYPTSRFPIFMGTPNADLPERCKAKLFFGSSSLPVPFLKKKKCFSYHVLVFSLFCSYVPPSPAPYMYCHSTTRTSTTPPPPPSRLPSLFLPITTPAFSAAPQSQCRPYHPACAQIDSWPPPLRPGAYPGLVAARLTPPCASVIFRLRGNVSRKN